MTKVLYALNASCRHPTQYFAISQSKVPLSKVILWKPVHGHRGRGRLRATYIDNVLIDAGVETAGELETLMLDRLMWRSYPGSSGSSR